MPQIVNISALAKLNLALAVGPPLDNGYHPICSWMVTIDICDELEVKRLEPDRLSRYAILWHKDAVRRSEIDWSIKNDLAVRAHLALERRLGRGLPVQMKLEKRIPVGGGLGGGSSDAAAMLRAVDELYELGLGDNTLAEVGSEIGTDVPFLVHGGSAIVEGLGDQIQHHERTPQLHAVVTFPQAICPTARVYGLFDDVDSPHGLRDEAVRTLAEAMPRSPVPGELFNDLTDPAIRAAPELEQCLAKISSLAERPAHVSGSGSSVFVLCDDPTHAEHLAQSIQLEHDLPAVAVKTVSSIAGRNAECETQQG